MEKKKGKFLKKIYSKLFSDLNFKEYMTYYYYNITFRRSKLRKMWAEPDEQESIAHLEQELAKMDREFLNIK